MYGNYFPFFTKKDSYYVNLSSADFISLPKQVLKVFQTISDFCH